MSHRAPREMCDWVTLCLSCELVTVPRNDEEVLYVLADDFAVIAPHGRHGVEKQCEGVKADIPELLVFITVALFQSDDVRKLEAA